MASTATAQEATTAPAAPAPATAAPAPAPATPAPATTAPPAEDEEKRPAPNSIYAEGLGAGIAYSINYERRVVDDLGVRLGFSYLSVSATAGTNSSSSSLITIPITASYLGIRGGKHTLEIGGGATIAYASGSGSSLTTSASGSGVSPYGVLFAGYRLHPVGHAGFQFRIGVMGMAGPGLAFSKGNPDKVGVIPWGYISLGASF